MQERWLDTQEEQVDMQYENPDPVFPALKAFIDQKLKSREWELVVSGSLLMKTDC